MQVARAALLALALAAAPARADVSAGRWELQVSVSVPGTEGSFGPFTQTECLGAADAGDPQRLFGGSRGTVSGCTFSNKRDDGSSYSFDVACEGMLPARGSGSVRYSSERIDGELTLRNDFGGQSLETRSRISGRRVGPCSQR